MEQMGRLVRVRDVEPLTGFGVRVEFEDGTIKEIRLEPYLHGPIFEPIRIDSSVFRSVKVQGITIAWENGADIDPCVLYYDLKPTWMEKPEAV